MRDAAKLAVRELFDVLEAHGVKEIICSPGSRNVPLMIAAEARRSLRKTIVVDERSAAFVAVGISQLQKQPVALICTSGSAVLNYAPAVAEAFYQGLPLIIISADRPKEWIDQDDSQTIHQEGVLNNIVKASYDIADNEVTEERRWYANRIFNEAVLTAQRPKEGPVHINIRLSPPLEEQIEVADSEQPAQSPLKCRLIERWDFPTLPLRAESSALARRLINKKVMIVAGFMSPDSVVNNHLRKFASHSNVCIMAETLSNLHLKAESYVIDGALCKRNEWTQERTEKLSPDIVISIGGALVSRMLKEYLRGCAAANPKMEHWAFGAQDILVDPFKALTLKFEMLPVPLLGQVSAELAHIKKHGVKTPDGIEKIELDPGCEAYQANWDEVKKAGHDRITRAASEAQWSELTAYAAIFSSMPKFVNLQLSNGAAVRYNQILTRQIPHSIFCNRGVSGIDGSTSTAVGNSIGSEIPAVLITGDMSASYDLSGLLSAVSLNSGLKIIVINNSGGGIFRFIKSTRGWEEREKYIGLSDRSTPFKGLAESFGFSYFRADSHKELSIHLKSFFSESGRGLLEVFVPAEESAEILQRLLS